MVRGVSGYKETTMNQFNVFTSGVHVPPSGGTTYWRYCLLGVPHTGCTTYWRYHLMGFNTYWGYHLLGVTTYRGYLLLGLRPTGVYHLLEILPTWSTTYWGYHLLEVPPTVVPSTSGTTYWVYQGWCKQAHVVCLYMCEKFRDIYKQILCNCFYEWKNDYMSLLWREIHLFSYTMTSP